MKHQKTDGATTLVAETETAEPLKENAIESPEPTVEQPTAMGAGDRFEIVPMVAICESKTNPRRVFDEEALSQLAESIRRNGVVTPLTLRDQPIGNTALLYEIIAGARRFRAAASVGLSEVPAVIKSNVSDALMIQMQLLENLQREDLNPMEEATGYKQLMDLGYDARQIGPRVGKSGSWVYTQVQLLKLIEAAQQALSVGEIELAGEEAIPFTRGHACEICRLQPEDQQRALEQMRTSIRSVRELKRWIAHNVHLSLGAAPFSIEDAELLPAAGACTVCPKRTGSNQELFADVEGDNICTDRACYEAKTLAFVELQTAKVEKETGKPALEISTSAHTGGKDGVIGKNQYLIIGEKGRVACPSTQKAVIVDGDNVGKVLDVCADQTCPKHFAKSRSAPAKTHKADSGSRSKEVERADREMRERARQEKLKHAKDAAIKQQVIDGVVSQVGAKLERRDLLVTLAALLAYAPWGVVAALQKVYGITSERTTALFDYAKKKLKDHELNQFLVRTAALGYATAAESNLKSLGTEYKIDISALAKKLDALQTSAKPPKPHQKAPAKVAGKAKSKAKVS